MTRTLTFEDKIHHADHIQGEWVYYTEIDFADGTLYALVRESKVIPSEGKFLSCIAS